jgi:hypothetical protein
MLNSTAMAAVTASSPWIGQQLLDARRKRHRLRKGVHVIAKDLANKRFSNGPGDVNSPGAAHSRFSKCRRSWLVPLKRDLVDWAGYTLLPCLASRVTCFSPWSSAKACQHDAIRRGSGEHYLGTRGSSDDNRLPMLRLHHVRRPGDGISGSKGNSWVCPLSDSSSSVIEAYTHCLAGHGGIFCAAEPRGHTPEAAPRFAPQAQRG